VSISFPSSPTSSTDYRLFSIPGFAQFAVKDVLKSGNQKTDWRIFRETGAEPYAPEELSGLSPFRPGEGYWLLKKGPLDISSLNIAMMPLNIYHEVLIDLHDGWNIIGNPFDRVVLAESIKTANGLSSLTLYHYNGSYTQSSVMEPFRGYYYFNGSTPLDSLAIPYPYILGNPPNNVSQMDWQVQLILETDINRDPENFIGIASSANEQLDYLDQRKPPLVFDQGFLYFPRPEWDGKYSRFSSDIRPVLSEGQIWDFEISNPRKSKGTICFHGIEQIPSEYDAMLINTHNSIPFDLRLSKEYTFQAVSEKMSFKFIVGKKSFIEGEQSKYIPAQYSLAQNYPNPFNPTTSISYSIPSEGDVRLEIFSVLGDRIVVLAEGRHTPAVYTVLWDGTDQHGNPVASGVYFYQLVAKGSLMQTKKMLLTR
ncbi:MAG TPA: T9SS type A sorting domain-containing protein, partial [Bacteroidota bacterium]|nr:T9SS type A sorting domain-containing protein [Bacteroidota bacterium]